MLHNHSPLCSYIPLYLQSGSDICSDRALYEMAYPAENFLAVGGILDLPSAKWAIYYLFLHGRADLLT